jgi:hypothetical protein
MALSQFCPHCGSTDTERMVVRSISESKLNFINEEGENFTDHFGPVQDTKCLNCSGEWLLVEQEDA